ncbi:MAG: flagellar protein G [Halobacteriota archaeon]
MADVSTPSLILFIASIVVAAGVAGVLVNTVDAISDSIDDRGGDVAQNIRTDVEVISDPESTVYSDGNLTLLVKNTGLREIPIEDRTIDVVVDGQYAPTVNVAVVDGSDWAVHGVIELTVDAPGLESGDHRVKLVIAGDEEIFRLRL